MAQAGGGGRSLCEVVEEVAGVVGDAPIGGDEEGACMRTLSPKAWGAEGSSARPLQHAVEAVVVHFHLHELVEGRVDLRLGVHLFLKVFYRR